MYDDMKRLFKDVSWKRSRYESSGLLYRDYDTSVCKPTLFWNSLYQWPSWQLAGY